MNKKDIAKIRKEFKSESFYLRIKEIYNVYAKRETGEIYHAESKYFPMLEQGEMNLFLENFKKVLSGGLDSKLFELTFERGVPDSTQHILYEGLSAPLHVWKEKMNQIVKKYYREINCDEDLVFTFIRAEYREPTAKIIQKEEEGEDDKTYLFPFILCSINAIDHPKQSIMFDYVEKEFKANAVTDIIVNLKSPLDGFLFPVYNNASDVNRILYSSAKTNQPNPRFVKRVLNCSFTFTAKEEKSNFEQILKNVVGEKVEPTVLASIYDGINKVVEENEGNSEEPRLDLKDIQQILKTSGIDYDSDEELKSSLQKAYSEIMDNEKYEFKARNLVPDYTKKSVKIQTSVADVSIRPSDIKGIKQVISRNGKRCLLIEVDEDVELDGFMIESERI